MDSKSLRLEFSKGKKHYQHKEYKKSEETYSKLYKKFPEKFNKWDKRFFAFSLYRVYIENNEDSNTLLEKGELLTELVSQTDLSKGDRLCLYYIYYENNGLFL